MQAVKGYLFLLVPKIVSNLICCSKLMDLHILIWYQGKGRTNHPPYHPQNLFRSTALDSLTIISLAFSVDQWAAAT